jgi:PKD repeat protein
VAVTVPDFGPITIDASQAGSFYLVNEQTRKTTPVVAGGPASVRAAASPEWADAGKPVNFTASDPYNPAGKLTTFRWDYGDGAKGEGLKAEHVYSTSGIYVASLTASDGKGMEGFRQVPVYVGQKTNNALVLRYPMMKIAAPIVYDASGRGNNGLRTGGQYVDDPERGTALELNGQSDCVPIFNTPDINLKGPYPNRTVSLWFKASDVNKRQTMYEEGGAGNGINLYLLNGKVCGGAWVGAVWPGTWLTEDKIPSNQWVHVAFVLRDAGAAVAPDKLELYVNGKKVASGPAAALPEHTADINVGRCGSSKYQDVPEADVGYYFGGRLGEVRVYNRALSEAEIADLAK